MTLRKLALGLWLLVASAAGCVHLTPPRTAVPTLPVTPPPASLPTPVPAVSKSAPPTAPAPNPTPFPSPSPCARPGRVETGSYPSETAGLMAYRVYLPPCYGEYGRSYPTLYLLPGNTHTDAIWDDLGVDEAAEAGILGQTLPPFLIVMADGGTIANNSSGGPGSFESVVMNDLIPYIEKTYCAWANSAGRAIGGISRGGYWALEIAFRHPDQFASVGGHSAALLDQFAWPAVNPQYTGLSQNLGDLRIYLDIGADDYVRQNIEKLHLDMETAVPPIPHTWVLNQGRHEEAYWQAHIPDYLAWYTSPWGLASENFPACRS